MRSTSGLVALGVLVALTGCATQPHGLTVDASTCTLGQSTANAGTITFTVSNPGTEVAGFALLDGDTVIGELTGLAPEASRALVVTLPKGNYIARCHPANGSEPINVSFTVTPGADTHIATSEQRDAAVAAYSKYIEEQSAALDRSVADFAADFAAGTATLEQYTEARAHWIALRPLSSSFSDLVPGLDAAENDLVDGEQWTGWQRIRSELTAPTLDAPGRAALAATLVDDTDQVLTRIAAAAPQSSAQIAAGAVDLIDHASQSLDDTAEARSSVAAAHRAFDALELLAEPALVSRVSARFDAAAAPSAPTLDALADSLAQLQGTLS